MNNIVKACSLLKNIPLEVLVKKYSSKMIMCGVFAGKLKVQAGKIMDRAAAVADKVREPVCPGVLLSDRDRVVAAVSGVVPVDYQVRAAGVEGYCYDMSPGAEPAAEVKRKMAFILGIAGGEVAGEAGFPELLRAGLDDYRPIDWHTDFKSGYCWAPLTGILM